MNRGNIFFWYEYAGIQDDSVATILGENNRLFTLARLGRRPPSGLAAITVVLVVLVLALIPGQILSRFIVRLLPIGARSVAEPIVQSVAMFLPIYLGLWVWLRYSSKRPFWTLGLESQGAVQNTLRGALIAGLMMALTAGLSIAPGASLTPGLWQTMGLAALGIRFLSLLGYFVQGPAEEILFRGWLLPVIGARYRRSACWSRRSFLAWLTREVTVLRCLDS